MQPVSTVVQSPFHPLHRMCHQRILHEDHQVPT